MNSRERVLAAINHREPDQIPFDLGGMAQSGIHKAGYTKLREYLHLPKTNTKILNLNTQQARFETDLLDRLRIDTVMVYSSWASPDQSNIRDDGSYWAYTDSWGVDRRMPKEEGQYFDVISHPLKDGNVRERFANYPWPDPLSSSRFEKLRNEAKEARAQGRFVSLMGLCPGIVEMYAWLRGFEQFYVDLATEPQIVGMFLDKMVELKAAYWQQALHELGTWVDAVNEADDMAGQTNLLFSPATYRRLVKPHHTRLFEAIKACAPQVKLIFHSCGAIRKLIPDFIEIGVDVLNPVQISATGMNPQELKKEFGKELCFWGGGVDAQNILTTGSTQEIRDNVHSNIDALAPGGGFVFAPTHIIQSSVPPGNIMVMWETLQEYRS